MSTQEFTKSLDPIPVEISSPVYEEIESNYDDPLKFSYASTYTDLKLNKINSNLISNVCRGKHRTRNLTLILALLWQRWRLQGY